MKEASPRSRPTTFSRPDRVPASRRLGALGLLLVLACASEHPMYIPEVDASDGPGTAVSVEHLDSYRFLTLKALVWWVGLSQQQFSLHCCLARRSTRQGPLFRTLI